MAKNSNWISFIQFPILTRSLWGVLKFTQTSLDLRMDQMLVFFCKLVDRLWINHEGILHEIAKEIKEND